VAGGQPRTWRSCSCAGVRRSAWLDHSATIAPITIWINHFGSMCATFVTGRAAGQSTTTALALPAPCSYRDKLDLVKNPRCGHIPPPKPPMTDDPDTIRIDRSNHPAGGRGAVKTLQGVSPAGDRQQGRHRPAAHQPARRLRLPGLRVSGQAGRRRGGHLRAGPESRGLGDDAQGAGAGLLPGIRWSSCARSATTSWSRKGG
jgi:hypothetical protein